MLAGVFTSDEEFLGLGSVLSGRTKGRWGRRWRGFYRRRGVPHLGSRVMGERATVTVTVSSGEETARG
jgi:hypothetical protein